MALQYENSSWKPCKPSAVSSIDAEMICVRISDEKSPIEVSSAQDLLILSTEIENFMPRLTGQIHFDLLGKIVWDANFPSGSISVPFKTHFGKKLELSSHYKSYNTKRKPCSKHPFSNANCKSNCRCQYTFALCKCWPLSCIHSPYRPPNVTLCGIAYETSVQAPPYSIPVLSSCLGGIQNSLDPTYQCQVACIPDCDVRNFLFTSENNLNSYDTAAIIRIEKFVYPIMEENLSMTASDFLNQFGGSIGLWVGGSILAFLHCFTSLMRIVAFYLGRNNNIIKSIYPEKSRSNHY